MGVPPCVDLAKLELRRSWALQPPLPLHGCEGGLAPGWRQLGRADKDSGSEARGWRATHWEARALLGYCSLVPGITSLLLQGLVNVPNITQLKRGYNLQQIFEGDVQNPRKGTFTSP